MTSLWKGTLARLLSPLASIVLIAAAARIPLANFGIFELPTLASNWGVIVPLIALALIVKVVVLVVGGNERVGFNGWLSFLLVFPALWLLGAMLGRWDIEFGTSTAYALSVALSVLCAAKAFAMLATGFAPQDTGARPSAHAAG